MDFTSRMAVLLGAFRRERNGSGVGGGHGRSMGRRQYRRAAGRIGKVLGGKNKSGQPGRC